jgi:hypothetical protein
MILLFYRRNVRIQLVYVHLTILIILCYVSNSLCNGKKSNKGNSMQRKSLKNNQRITQQTVCSQSLKSSSSCNDRDSDYMPKSPEELDQLVIEKSDHIVKKFVLFSSFLLFYSLMFSKESVDNLIEFYFIRISRIQFGTSILTILVLMTLRQLYTVYCKGWTITTKQRWVRSFNIINTIVNLLVLISSLSTLLLRFDPLIKKRISSSSLPPSELLSIFFSPLMTTVMEEYY